MKKKAALLFLLALALLAILAVPAAGMAEPPDEQCPSPNSGSGHHDWRVTQYEPATCTEDGYKEWTCYDCGQTHVEEYSAGHDFQVVEKEPTCVEAGYKGLKCTRCGETARWQDIPATGHTPVTVPGKAPTCTEPGLTEGSKCSVCGAVINEQTQIPATGHTPVMVPGKAATCTEPGLTEGSKCSVCGAVITEQTQIPATGHTPVAVPGKAATCTEPGLTEGSKCSVCGAVITEQIQIPAKGHTPVTIPGVTPKCMEKGLSEGQKCSVCGAVLVAQQELPIWGHHWDEGEITKEAGYLNPGEITYHCLRCDATKTEEIPVKNSGSMYSLLRNNSPIPGDPAGKGPDETEPLHIVWHPQGGRIKRNNPDDCWHIMTVTAEGGVEPYTYTWYKVANSGTLEALSESKTFSGLTSSWAKLTDKYTVVKGTNKEAVAALSGLGVTSIGILSDPPESILPISILDEKILNNDVDNYWADDIGSYYCIVTDAEGTSVKSDIAEVTWELGIRSWSGNTPGYMTAELWVKVDGGLPPYTYQWEQLLPDGSAKAVGCTEATYPAPTAPYGENDYPYVCHVWDAELTEVVSEPMLAYKANMLIINHKETDIKVDNATDTVPFAYAVYGGYGHVTVIITDLTGNEVSKEVVINDFYNADVPQERTFTAGIGEYTLTATDEANNIRTVEFSVSRKPLVIDEHPFGGELPLDGSGVKVSVTVTDGVAPYTYKLRTAATHSTVLTQDSPEFVIRDEQEYEILVMDSEGRWGVSDPFHCIGYDGEFSDGCTAHEVYIYEPNGEAIMDLNPIGTQAPYTVKWGYRPKNVQDIIPLDWTDLTLTVSRRGEYIYRIFDKNGQYHEGSILVSYAGDIPWILASPQSVTLNNNLENQYSVTFKADAVGSSGSSDGLRFIWERGSAFGNWWEPLTNTPGSVELMGKTVTLHGEEHIGYHYRCRIVDDNTGGEACTDYATLFLAMHARAMQSDNDLEVFVDGGKEPYRYTVRRHRDGYYPPTLITNDHNKYVEEDYPLKKYFTNPPGTNISFDLVIYDVDLWDSDWYKSSGFMYCKKHYHRFAWTYDITVTDQNGATVVASVTCTFDKPLEWASYN